MINKKTFLPWVFAIFAITACKKSATPISKPITNPNVDVYVVGTKKALNGAYVAAYWKNGVETKLTDSSRVSSFAYAIKVDGADVYVAGSSEPFGGGVEMATYWKNGTPVQLGAGMANAIFINGADVYVAGFGGFWKNGVAIKLPEVYDTNSIAIKGADTYVIGAVMAKNGNSIAAFWKNGVLKKLIDSTLFSYAKGVFIQGNDIYISGYTQLKSTGPMVATYWKNDRQNSLPDTGFSAALSIAVNGTDVYMAGYTNARSGSAFLATYWKNGVQRQFGNPSNDTYATAIKINGTDVYVAGVFAGVAPSYWLNDKFIQFTSFYGATGYSIFLAPK